MSSLLTPGERPGIWEKIGDLARRVSRLEAVKAIICDVLCWDQDNQGGYLYAQSNDTVDLDSLEDPLGVGGLIGAAIEDATGAGAVFGSTGLVTIKSAAGDVSIEASTGQISIRTTGPPVQIIAGATTWSIHDVAGSCLFGQLHNGGQLQIQDHLGNPIFEVRDNGSVHIPTGTAVIADL